MYIEVPRRKNLYFRNMILSCIAVAMIGWSIGNRWESDREMGAFVLLMGIFLLINIAIVVNSIKQALKKSPALVLTDEGIIDNISSVQLDLIKWDEISDCEVKKYRGAMQLLITLKDNRRALAWVSSFNENLVKKAIKDTGAAIVINCDTLQYNRQLLKEAILQKIGRVHIDQHLITNSY